MSARPKEPPAVPSPDTPTRVAVLGFARSGRALAEALAARGVEVAVSDRRPEAELDGVEALRRRGVRFFLGGDDPEFLAGAGWLAVSPGVPLNTPAVERARDRGVPVLSELEVAWRIAEAEGRAHRWIAVTGTNGKSTTASWIAEILRRSGRPVTLAGNIGAPLSGFLSEPGPRDDPAAKTTGGNRDFVCEVSSFQLETVDLFRPHLAVLTNVTPDHLDRHRDMDEYAAAKARLFARQGPEDFAVLNADDPRAVAVTTRARRVLFSRRAPTGGAWLEAGRLRSAIRPPVHDVVGANELALPGAHNVENALAALAAAECLGTPEEAIVAALKRFEGLPHRTQLVAESGGIRWVDDSKGTNVDAAAKSLEEYPDGSVLLILGGRDKHGDFAMLAPAVARAARVVLTIGEAAPAVEAALSGAARIESCVTMTKAVDRAAALARPGDTVLLSPACASFDQYRDYEERGDHFASLVRKAIGIPSSR